MEISEVRIKLVEESSERLRAFCSITLDGDFVIRDLKIIDGVSGPFVAMPSRKLADRCPRCGCKNHLRARYCNDCGVKLNENRAPKDGMGRAKLHADVAHPINAACRERIQVAVVKAYGAELERSKLPDYKPPAYDDFGDDDITHLVEDPNRPSCAAAPPAGPVDEEEPAVVAEAHEESAAFSDYNSLIADLRREAAGRHGREDRGPAPYAQSRPAPQRSERGGEHPRREAGRSDRGDRPERNENRAARGDRQGRNDRGPRPNHRDDRRDERRRDEAHGSVPKADPAPIKSPPPPAMPPASEEDDFAAGL